MWLVCFIFQKSWSNYQGHQVEPWQSSICGAIAGKHSISMFGADKIIISKNLNFYQKCPTSITFIEIGAYCFANRSIVSRQKHFLWAFDLGSQIYRWFILTCMDTYIYKIWIWFKQIFFWNNIQQKLLVKLYIQCVYKRQLTYFLVN